MWRLSQTTVPGREPLAADSPLLLQHLRLDAVVAREQAALLGAYVAAARAACETLTGRQLIDASWSLFLDSWCEEGVADGGDEIAIPVGPIDTASVVVTYVDETGTTRTLAGAAYTVAQDAGPNPRRARIRPAVGTTWPGVRDQGDAIEVAFDAGYGADESAIPGPLLSGLLLYIGELYERRELATIGTIVTPNVLAAERLWQSMRLF